MKCVDCPDYKACHRQNDLRKKRHKCKKANEPFVQTNADRYRAMSDEELAEQLIAYRDDWDDYETHVGCFDKWEDAVKAEVDYLRQPVKDGDNDG